MNRLRYWRTHLGRPVTSLVAIALTLACCAAPVQAQSLLTLAPSELTLQGTPGQTFEVSGAITNRTQYTLGAADLSLNFSNYDPLFLNPTQVLGAADYSIESYHVVDGLALFTLSLSDDATGDLNVDVVLQDVYGDLSDPVTMSVHVLPVPEPATAWMLAAGLLGLVPPLRRARKETCHG